MDNLDEAQRIHPSATIVLVHLMTYIWIYMWVGRRRVLHHVKHFTWTL